MQPVCTTKLNLPAETDARKALSYAEENTSVTLCHIYKKQKDGSSSDRGKLNSHSGATLL